MAARHVKRERSAGGDEDDDYHRRRSEVRPMPVEPVYRYSKQNPSDTQCTPISIDHLKTMLFEHKGEAKIGYPYTTLEECERQFAIDPVRGTISGDLPDDLQRLVAKLMVYEGEHYPDVGRIGLPAVVRDDAEIRDIVVIMRSELNQDSKTESKSGGMELTRILLGLGFGYNNYEDIVDGLYWETGMPLSIEKKRRLMVLVHQLISKPESIRKMSSRARMKFAIHITQMDDSKAMRDTAFNYIYPLQLADIISLYRWYLIQPNQQSAIAKFTELSKRQTFTPDQEDELLAMHSNFACNMDSRFDLLTQIIDSIIATSSPTHSALSSRFKTQYRLIQLDRELGQLLTQYFLDEKTTARTDELLNAGARQKCTNVIFVPTASDVVNRNFVKMGGFSNRVMRAIVIDNINQLTPDTLQRVFAEADAKTRLEIIDALRDYPVGLNLTDEERSRLEQRLNAQRLLEQTDSEDSEGEGDEDDEAAEMREMIRIRNALGPNLRQ